MVEKLQASFRKENECPNHNTWMTNCKFCLLKEEGGCNAHVIAILIRSAIEICIPKSRSEPNLAPVGNRCYSLSQNWN